MLKPCWGEPLIQCKAIQTSNALFLSFLRAAQLLTHICLRYFDQIPPFPLDFCLERNRPKKPIDISIPSDTKLRLDLKYLKSFTE